MSFSREINAARAKAFENEVKALAVKRREERALEKKKFLQVMNAANDRLEEIKEGVLEVARKGGNTFHVIESFTWIKPPFFKAAVDFDGANLDTIKLLTEKIVPKDPQWRATYRKFMRESIDSKEFLLLWDNLEELGLEPYFEEHYANRSFRFCVRF